MTGTAIISPDGVYRYRLTRRSDMDIVRSRPCVFCMLNPSTADARMDDPTIRRCSNFALSWSCTRLIVVNLFALRATDPQEIYAHDDPVGPEGDTHLLAAAAEALPHGLFVCAWGTHGAFVPPGFARPRGQAVRDLLRQAGHQLHCLGLTKDGHPKHPLYLRSDTIPQEFP